MNVVVKLSDYEKQTRLIGFRFSAIIKLVAVRVLPTFHM